MRFEAPRGLAFSPDGNLFVADARRNVVYRIEPEAATGVVGPQSFVGASLGNGSARHATEPGDRQPVLAFPVNQPLRLSYGEDGLLLVQTHDSIIAVDPLAREAEVLLVDGGRDEIGPSLSGASNGQPVAPASLLAVTSTLILSRTLPSARLNGRSSSPLEDDDLAGLAKKATCVGMS